MTEPTYPYADGDVTVLGPEIFASTDGDVISWKGDNYVRQAAVSAGVAPATGQAALPVEWAPAVRDAFWTAVNAPTYEESTAATLAFAQLLPAPADRATVCADIADTVEHMQIGDEDPRPDDRVRGYNEGLQHVLAELRRMAAESAPADTGHNDGETLPEDEPTESVLYEVVGDWGVDGVDSAEAARAAVAKWLRAYPRSGAHAQQRIHREWPDGSEFYGPWTDLPEQPAAAQQPICKCPAEICQCGHHKAQQPKEARPLPIEELLATRCDACRHSLARHHQHGVCTVVLCVCGTFQYPVEELPQ